MKKFILCFCFILFMGCSADLSKYTNVDASSSIKAKMNTCLFNQANAKFQAGTLFSNSITTTAKELILTCVKDLSLQQASIPSDTQSTAESIIQNLKTIANK